MLLLSFASQTSHFWQLGGVMQAKMRSLLRLLVKSIIGNRERQADATAAWEAHHSVSPIVDPSVQNTQDTGTDTHAQRVTEIGKPTLRNRIQHFYCHTGTYLLLSHQKEVGNARKSMVETHSNVMAVKHELFYFAWDVLCQTINDGFDSSLPKDTPSGFIYSTVTGTICSRASLTSLFYHK